MPTASAVRPPPLAHEQRRTQFMIILAVGLGAAVVLRLLTGALADPDRVDLVIENPTAYAVDVRVRSAEGGPLLGLGTAAPRSTRGFTSVIDQGERWVFEFRYAGITAAERSVAERELEGGPIHVPRSLERVLDDADVVPPPSPP